MITKDLKPHQVCEAIGLCDNARSAFPVSAVVEQEHEKDEGPLCTLCEYTISDLDRYITDPHNEDEVKSALDRVCYELRFDLSLHIALVFLTEFPAMNNLLI